MMMGVTNIPQVAFGRHSFSMIRSP
jgi:hypothetical protein